MGFNNVASATIEFIEFINDHLLIEVDINDLRNVNKSDFARPAFSEAVIHLIIDLIIHPRIKLRKFLSKVFLKRWLGFSSIFTKKSSI
jgi:hypothetical protein